MCDEKTKPTASDPMRIDEICEDFVLVEEGAQQLIGLDSSIPPDLHITVGPHQHVHIKVVSEEEYSDITQGDMEDVGLEDAMRVVGNKEAAFQAISESQADSIQELTLKLIAREALIQRYIGDMDVLRKVIADERENAATARRAVRDSDQIIDDLRTALKTIANVTDLQ